MRSYFIPFFLLSQACSHTPARNELDIKPQAQARFEGTDPSKLAPEKIFEWQKYYKTPPSGTEREELAF